MEFARGTAVKKTTSRTRSACQVAIVLTTALIAGCGSEDSSLSDDADVTAGAATVNPTAPTAIAAGRYQLDRPEFSATLTLLSSDRSSVEFDLRMLTKKDKFSGTFVGGKARAVGGGSFSDQGDDQCAFTLSSAGAGAVKLAQKGSCEGEGFIGNASGTFKLASGSLVVGRYKVDESGVLVITSADADRMKFTLMNDSPAAGAFFSTEGEATRASSDFVQKLPDCSISFHMDGVESDANGGYAVKVQQVGACSTMSNGVVSHFDLSGQFVSSGPGSD